VKRGAPGHATSEPSGGLRPTGGRGGRDRHPGLPEDRGRERLLGLAGQLLARHLVELALDSGDHDRRLSAVVRIQAPADLVSEPAGERLTVAALGREHGESKVAQASHAVFRANACEQSLGDAREQVTVGGGILIAIDGQDLDVYERDRKLVTGGARELAVERVLQARGAQEPRLGVVVLLWTGQLASLVADRPPAVGAGICFGIVDSSLES
jgi:hypothetical protein